MRKTNEALTSENARLKEQVEKQDAAIKQLTSTVTDLMGRFAKLESTVDCKETERKLSELEV
jgi:outer membrane murein-binding lipoprotein Lpp